MKEKEFIETQIKEFREFLRGLLPDVNNVRLDEGVTMMLTYDAIIRQNFILWLMLMNDKAKTEKAKTIIKENLDCEIGENHPQLLLNVTKQSLGLVASEHLIQLYEKSHLLVYSASAPLAHLTSRCIKNYKHAAHGLFIMTLLENGSLEFISWMREVAIHRLDIEDTKYFDIHGEADIQHASSFAEAFNEEVETDSTFHTHVFTRDRSALEAVFKIIFSPVNRK